MRRTTRPAGRAGFTLIELLIVIAILALLAALVAAGIGKVRDAQQSRVTDQTLTKLHLALNQQWKAVCDQCRDDARSLNSPTPNPQFKAMVTICDNDKDRAEALWMFLNLRRAMPKSFAEARADVVMTNGAVTVTLPKSSAFKDVFAKTGSTPDKESAVLLYLIVTQGGRGTTFALDDAMQGAQTSLDVGGGAMPAFKDSFGTHIGYERFQQGGELESGAYIRAGLKHFTDPLDPVGRLNQWPNAAVKATAQTQSGATFNGKNRMAVAISAGADQAFGTDDDAYSYRVATQGSKGD